MRVMKKQHHAGEETGNGVPETRHALPKVEELGKEMERTRKLLERRMKG